MDKHKNRNFRTVENPLQSISKTKYTTSCAAQGIMGKIGEYSFEAY